MSKYKRWGFQTLIIGLLLIITSFVGGARADEGLAVYGGALTYHFDRDTKYNETNLLGMVEYDGYVVGAFNNSYYNDTYLLANHRYIEKEGIQLGWLLGGMYGYESYQTILPCSGKYCLLAAPVLKFTDYSWQPTFIFGGNFVSFMIGYEF